MFVTFYSYKGGVGRSMALANVACLLAEDREHAQRVLLWDFDLEAPGLHKLFPPQEPFRRGFVDMAFEFANTQTMPDPQEFVYASALKGVDVLPAGRVDQAYCSKLEKLDWMGFFGDDPAGMGEFFGQLTSWMSDESEELGKRYDYVLIDSRTGLNDVAGICTQVLPDLLLFIFRLTDQNLDGIDHLVPTIRTQLKKREKRNVRILPVASVVLSQSSEDLDERRKRAISVFDCHDLDYVRFDPDLISDEKLFCRKEVKRTMWPPPPIVDDYERLSGAIRKRNPYDTQTASQQLDKRMSTGDFASARIVLGRLLKRRPEAPRTWAHLRGLCLNIPEREARFADKLVDDILLKSKNNVFAMEWKASECAAKAESPDDDELGNARTYLDEALRFGMDRDKLRLHRKLSEVARVVGDLELAAKELKSCHTLAENNVQVLLDLARVYVRRGRDYFALAADLFEGREDDAIDPMLIYLWTFLNQEEKAENCFRICQEQSPRFSDTQYAQLVSAHQYLIRGQVDRAMQIAEDSIQSADDQPDETELANWAEFFLCAEEFRRAVEILEDLQSGEETPPELFEYRGLMTLARFLAAEPATSLEKTLEAWNHPAWSFTELLFFRERVKAAEKCSYRDRLSVIEELIKKSELTSHSSWSEGSVFWRRFRNSSRVVVSHWIPTHLAQSMQST